MRDNAFALAELVLSWQPIVDDVRMIGERIPKKEYRRAVRHALYLHRTFLKDDPSLVSAVSAVSALKASPRRKK